MAKLAGIALSVLLLSITGFYYADAQTQVQKTTAESSFGVLKINSGVFSASKYSSATITVSGGVTTILRGTPITLQIIKPDNTIETEGILVNKDGNFSVPIVVNGNWPLGNYSITATYGDNEIGTVYFQVVTENTKTTAQTTKILSYENKQYGFSLKYPSDLKKEEKLEKDQVFPNAMDIVDFTTPSELSTITVILIKDDTIFTGLNDQKFLDKMKNEFESRLCSTIPDPTLTCSMEVIDEQSGITQNDYNAYISTYAFTISDNKNSQKLVTFSIMYPDGNDVWALILAAFSGETYKDIGVETGKMADSFRIYDYKGIQSFSLYSKASQENDIVYLAIKNPKESSDDIYGIKLTNINGKITNFLKINGWNYVRVGTDSVIYQTPSSPLTPSYLIKIALKVDSKNTEIKWEAFSKDKTSLGTGTVKP